MRIENRIFFLALVPALLFGQLTWNTVTVTSSRASSPQPDQVVFSVAISSALDQGLDDVVKALAGSGITAANLVTINAQPNPPVSTAPLSWVFQLSAPLSRFKEISASLTSLQQTIAQKNAALSLNFSVQYAQASAQPSPACDFAGLVADARAQAQKLAAAAGFTPGAIVGVSSIVGQSIPACFLTVRFALGTALVPSSGPNAITITASRSANLQPDQVSIALIVSSGLTSGLDDVTAALAGAGITGAQFMGMGTGLYYYVQPQTQSVLNWSFALTSPLSRLKDTLAQIVVAQQTIAKQKSVLSLTFYIQGLQASPQSQPSCQASDLVADARTRAQQVAAAAGASLGGILTLADAPTAVPAAAPTFAVLGGSIGTTSAPALGSFLLSTPAYGCSLAVQFQML